MAIWRPLCFIQFLVALLTLAFLGLTGDPGKYVPLFHDKLMHCGGYIAAGISISFAFPRSKFRWRAAFLILYSIGIEIGQHFMPPRTFDVCDIFANSTGVLVGLALVAMLAKRLAWFNRLLNWQSPSPQRIHRTNAKVSK